MSPHLRGHIVFGADPVGVSMTLSCLHNVLRASGWILIRFMWLYYKDTWQTTDYILMILTLFSRSQWLCVCVCV